MIIQCNLIMECHLTFFPPKTSICDRYSLDSFSGHFPPILFHSISSLFLCSSSNMFLRVYFPILILDFFFLPSPSPYSFLCFLHFVLTPHLSSSIIMIASFLSHRTISFQYKLSTSLHRTPPSLFPFTVSPTLGFVPNSPPSQFLFIPRECGSLPQLLSGCIPPLLASCLFPVYASDSQIHPMLC